MTLANPQPAPTKPAAWLTNQGLQAQSSGGLVVVVQAGVQLRKQRDPLQAAKGRRQQWRLGGGFLALLRLRGAAPANKGACVDVHHRRATGSEKAQHASGSGTSENGRQWRPSVHRYNLRYSPTCRGSASPFAEPIEGSSITFFCLAPLSPPAPSVVVQQGGSGTHRDLAAQERTRAALAACRWRGGRCFLRLDCNNASEHPQVACWTAHTVKGSL